MEYIKHIGIYVKNREMMKRFYTSVFMMKVIQSEYCDSGFFYNQLMGVCNTNVIITKLITERGVETKVGDMIELIEVVEGPLVNRQTEYINFIGTMHIAFGVSNIQSSIDAIRDYGGEVVISPFRRENGNWLAFAKDVEGNWLEIIQNV